MEGKLAAHILNELAEADGLPKHQIERLKEHTTTLERIVDGLGLCLSEEGDLLSQWRGYANDGRGVSIGFSKQYFEELSEIQHKELQNGEEKSGFTLKKVEYEQAKHFEAIEPIYKEIKGHIEAGAFNYAGKTLLTINKEEDDATRKKRIQKASSALTISIFKIFGQLFAYKLDAFNEEREWRLVSYSAKSGKEECEFKAADDRIIPYREYDMVKTNIDPILKIILGPRNQTPAYVIKNMFHKYGFENVSIKRSKATYR
jgi:hypothetical protein